MPRHPEEPAWARWWPVAERRVRRALGRLGVEADDAPELVQEAAIRLIVSGAEVSSVDELAAWTYTVASRLAVDRARRWQPTILPLVDDIVDPVDTAAVVEARTEWEEVAAVARRLSPGDRMALLSAFSGTPATRAEAVRWAVRRHRARLRLLALLGRTGAAVTAAWAVVRRVARPRWASVSVAAPAVVLVVAFLPTPLESGESGPASPAPASSDELVAWWPPPPAAASGPGNTATAPTAPTVQSGTPASDRPPREDDPRGPLSMPAPGWDLPTPRVYALETVKRMVPLLDVIPDRPAPGVR